ncbi:MAG: LacI family DNA-binding transcriptional regulator [Lachnospiraceae bacterium]
MSKGKVTIKQVAEMAGVSIATVSHVINRTRYVKPELAARVEQAMEESGYIEKVTARERGLKTGKKSVIMAVFPDIESSVYRNQATHLKKFISDQGYQFYICTSNDDLHEEEQILSHLLMDKRIAGILLAPVSDDPVYYKKLIESQIPFVCMERNIFGENIDAVEFRDRDAIYKGSSYLINCGHKNLLFLRENTESTTRDERTKGFVQALEQNQLNTNYANIADIDLAQDDDKCQFYIKKALNRTQPTAVITSGNRLTLLLVKTIRDMGIECPGELSIVGFGADGWCEVVMPPLTTLDRDVMGLSRLAVNMLFEKINTGKVISRERYADVELHIRKSTRMLDNGPFGEKAVAPEEIVISPEEKSRLRSGKYRVAISFHYTGTAWAALHEQGIRDELELFGIDVVSVMDARFDAQLQIMQLEGIRIQQPDAVIAIPTDDKATAAKFQELSKVTKLVFLSNVPENLWRNSYVSCVSVNEWENGTSVGRMMGEHLRKTPSAKVGFINHGAVFYGTSARDAAAQKVVMDDYAAIDIVVSRGFKQIDNAYQLCKDILEEFPEICALYVSWDQPALKVIKALKELKRTDIAVFTTDLDYEIASYMEEGIVKGLSAQKPYEQGRAAALVVAKSLVSDQVPKYVGVQPYEVYPKQLRRAWKDVLHETIPDELLPK